MTYNQILPDERYLSNYIGSPHSLRKRMENARFHPQMIDSMIALYKKDPAQAIQAMTTQRLWDKPQLNILNEKVFTDSVQEWFKTSDGLKDKVAEDGTLKPFYGNTVVFGLDDASKAQIEQIRRALYEECADMLADELDWNTYHVTLHDLANGTPETLDRAHMKDLGRWARILLDEIRTGDFRPISLLGTWSFNMVNTSIVLGFRPWEFEENLDSWNRLSDLYSRFQLLHPLNYELTPHVTLAYFKPGEYDGDILHKLKQHVNPHPIRLTLRMEDLVLQEFESMNDYRTVY